MDILIHKITLFSHWGTPDYTCYDSVAASTFMSICIKFTKYRFTVIRKTNFSTISELSVGGKKLSC